MGDSGQQDDLRVLLLAPTPRDGEASRAVLASAGIDCVLCADVKVLCGETAAGAAAIIIPEEVVVAEASDRLAQMIRQQPVWSDLPVIVLTRQGIESPAGARALSTLGNVTLVERPVRVSTLVSVVRVAIRARQRQYQTRDHLAEHVRAEEAIREARDRAQAADRAKEQFLAVLSHELRTPLSPVVMALGAIEKDAALPEHLREPVAMVRRNIDLETKLIDDLLDVSRVASGKLRLRAEAVRLHELLRHVSEVCAEDAATKRLQVVTDFRATGDRVTGDPARLQQVFWNLLKNAIKFSEEGGRITLATREVEGGRVRVEVSDAGVGIPGDVLPRLFHAFEQGDPNVTRRFGGLGLGLAISKAVVDLHGGSIRAESDGAGKGARFVVELAVGVEEEMEQETRSRAAAAAAAAAMSAPGGGARKARTRRILVVEDHVDTQRVLSRLLAEAGYEVKSAGTVAAALKLAEAERFDLLVSDIGLPDKTGYELMEEMRRRHGVKGIALSGYGMEGDMQRSRDAGFVDHLTKPVDVEQLEAVIERVSERGR
jgi:signal transduction histidine kinase